MRWREGVGEGDRSEDCLKNMRGNMTDGEIATHYTCIKPIFSSSN